MFGNFSNFFEMDGVYVILFVMLKKDGFVLVWEFFVFKFGFI